VGHEAAVRLVIFELRLPDADGISLIAPIRRASPKTRVIAMSEINDPNVAAEAKQEGAAAFLAKPIDFGVLMNTLDLVSHSDESGASTGTGV